MTMKQSFKLASVILLAATFAVPALAQGPGATVYNTSAPKCGMCHGVDGLAASPMAKNMKVLSFKAPAMVKASNAQFIDSTANGKGRMPAYKGKLTDAQIKDVVGYIRTLQK
jgi:mono/diheme cytochrome c family protein